MLFPEVNALQLAFLGPLVGALSRSSTGWVADRFGGARVTLWVFVLMTAGVGGVLWFIGVKEQPGAYWGFFASFLVLFFATGVGNASTFQMIPAISARETDRLMPDADPAARRRQAEKEAAAITGFTSAIAAFGAFFIPKAFGSSIALTGGAEFALWGFLVFYVICLAVTWTVYARPGGVLHGVERALRSSRRVATAA
jgi:NNP family nitrate/nitrite transporter-like MFS transporter